MKVTTLLFTLFAATFANDEVFAKDGPVKIVSDETFGDVTKTAGSVIMLFWAPWNEKSTDAAEDLIAAATALADKDNIVLAAIDCTNAGKVSCSKTAKIRSFPTFNKYLDGELVETFQKSFSSDEIVTLAEDTTKKGSAETPAAKGFGDNYFHSLYSTQIVNNEMGRVVSLWSEMTNDFKKSGTVAIHYSSQWCFVSQHMAPRILEAAKDINEDVKLGVMDCAVKDNVDYCLKDMHIGALPVLIIYKDGKEVRRVGGSRSTEFVSGYINDENFKVTNEAGDKEDWWIEIEGVDIVQLTNDNFDDYVNKHKTTVTFYNYWNGYFDGWRRTLFDVSKEITTSGLQAETGTLAVVECHENAEVCDRFGLDKVQEPWVFHFPGDGQHFEFEYERSAKGLLEFMKRPQTRAAAASERLNLNPNDFSEDAHKVTLLNSFNVLDTLQNKDQSTFIFFYAPWCSHCKKFKKTWIALADKYANDENTVIAAIDCEFDKDLCDDFRVESYPTIQHFAMEKNQPKVTPYNAPRTVKYMSKFLNDPTPENAKEIVEGILEAFDHSITHMNSEEEFNTFIKDNARVLVWFFSPECPFCKDARSSIAKASRTLPKENGVIAAVNCLAPSLRQLCESSGVPGYPTYMLYRTGREATTMTIEPKSPENIVKFIKNPMMKLKDSHSMGVWDDTPQITVLGTEQDADAFFAKNEVSLVFFYAHWCEHSKKQFGDYKELVKKVPSHVRAAVFDCELGDGDNRKFCKAPKHNIQAYPMLRLVHKELSYPYQGADNVKNWVQWASAPPRNIPTFTSHPDVTIVTEANYSHWQKKHSENVIFFYSHYSTFSKKALPAWELAAANAAKEGLTTKFLVMNCEIAVDTCDFLAIDSYPTVYYTQQNDEATKQSLFEANPTAENFLAFAKDPQAVDLDKVKASWAIGYQDNTLVTRRFEAEEAKKHIAENKHVLLFIYATWCGHCTKAKPVIEGLSRELEGKATIVAVDGPANREYATEYGVTGFPHVIYFKDGVKTGEPMEGFGGKQAVLDMIQFDKEEL